VRDAKVMMIDEFTDALCPVAVCPTVRTKRSKRRQGARVQPEEFVTLARVTFQNYSPTVSKLAGA